MSRLARTITAALFGSFLGMSGACSRRVSPDTGELAPSASALAVRAPATASASASGTPEPTVVLSSPVAEPTKPPDGYVAMSVVAVTPTEHGDAVLLGDAAQPTVVPIFIGGTEALSIRLRLDGQRYQRPLTHDLLDDLVGRLGGAVWKVHVDGLKGNTFVGRVFVRQGGRTLDVDARPSDAIALALGSKVPIFVARTVVEATGLKKQDLERTLRDRLDPPGKTPEPMSL